MARRFPFIRATFMSPFMDRLMWVSVPALAWDSLAASVGAGRRGASTGTNAWFFSIAFLSSHAARFSCAVPLVVSTKRSALASARRYVLVCVLIIRLERAGCLEDS